MQSSEQSNFLRAEAELLLEQSRKAKAEKIKDLGEPIQLSGAALDIQVRGNFAWIAENTSVARKIDLEVESISCSLPSSLSSRHSQTGKAVQVFRGHTAPVTALAFYDKVHGSRDEKLLITGSWDKVPSPPQLMRHTLTP
ncbi:hypothetical protein NLI96_g7574 [Meripilus lineatus]|uniref:Uncharacterized protein n=1 Tax=Meripilus lineatus TaxID=2056292 RepID=A0AAD5YH20_9APHY|nr:hypothetical protein NLI96_g7574 [Physisporinus lineatus]